jgi:hypothetical protein
MVISPSYIVSITFLVNISLLYPPLTLAWSQSTDLTPLSLSLSLSLSFLSDVLVAAAVLVFVVQPNSVRLSVCLFVLPSVRLSSLFGVASSQLAVAVPVRSDVVVKTNYSVNI